LSRAYNWKYQCRVLFRQRESLCVYACCLLGTFWSSHCQLSPWYLTASLFFLQLILKYSFMFKNSSSNLDFPSDSCTILCYFYRGKQKRCPHYESVKSLTWKVMETHCTSTST
jgi:hypothetical protein